MLKKMILLAAVGTLVWGCAKRQVVRPPEQPVITPPSAAEPQEEPSIRYADWQGLPQLRPVFFDYDSSNLNNEGRETLKANADYLENNEDLSILVEGHADERGTTEYNLALGQRRAAAVRDYYGNLGIPPARVGTISYGEEMPADTAHNENAWAKNRRAETKVRSR